MVTEDGSLVGENAPEWDSALAARIAEDHGVECCELADGSLACQDRDTFANFNNWTDFRAWLGY